jgi:hypothetical protein
VEYSEVFRVFFGQKWYIFSKIIFFFCVTCLNISSIVDTAQTVDTFLAHWVDKGSGAFHFRFFQENGNLLHTEWVRWDYSGCSEHQLLEGDCIPFFEHEGIVLTIGYMAVTAFFVPLALMDLKVRTHTSVNEARPSE